MAALRTWADLQGRRRIPVFRDLLEIGSNLGAIRRALVLLS